MSATTAYCPSCGHHVAGAAFCAACGSAQSPNASAAAFASMPATMSILPVGPAGPPASPPPPVAPTAAAIPSQPSSGNACPVCHSADALRRVSNIIDAGRSETTGTSDSVNLDTWDVTVSAHQFSTRGALGDRLCLPEPQDRAGWVAGGTCLVSIVVMGVINAAMSPEAAESNAVLMVFFALFLFPALGAGAYYAFSGIKEAQKQYVSRAQQSRLGYYCARDDVAFLPGGPARSPEDYVRAFS